MAKLSSYTKDTAITDKDKLAGSSFVGLVNGIPKYQTASYTIEDLGAYFSENITIGGQIYDIETIYNDLERTKTYTLGLQESFWSSNEDGSLNTLSVAFANQVFSVTTSSKFATSSYVNNLGTSFGEFDVEGHLVSLAEAFANQVFTTTTSSKFATSLYVNNLGSSVGTLNPDGTLASLSEAFANSVITTTTSDKFAESTRVNTLGATLGVYDVNGNTIIASNAAFLDSVTVYVDGNSATASKVEELNSTLNLLDENGNAIYTNAQYLSNITTYVDDNSATASKVDQLNSALNILDVNGNATVTNAEYLESITTHVDANSASAAIARGLNTELGITDADGVIIKTKAQFDEEVSQYVDANSATASKVTNLNSTLDLLDVNGNALYTNAEYLDNITTHVDTNSASAEIARGLNSELGITDEFGAVIKTKAQFDEEISQYVDENSATASKVTSINSTLNILDVNGDPIYTNAQYLDNITTYVDTNAASAKIARGINTEFAITDANGVTIKTKAQFDEEITSYVDANSATAGKVTNLNSVLNILDAEGNATVTSADYLDSITTYVDENSATASKVSNLGSAFGNFDGNTFSISEAKITEELNTYTALNFSNSTYFQGIESNIAGKPSVYRQVEQPIVSVGPPQSPANGSIWYDTGNENKVYVLTSGVWEITDDSRIGATASKLNTVTAAFGSYDVNTGFTFDGNSYYADQITTHVDTNSATAEKTNSLATQFTFDVNGAVTGTSGTLSQEITDAESNATGAAASKVETLAANFFNGYSGDDGSFTEVAFSEAIKTQISTVVSTDGYAAANDLNTLRITVQGEDGESGIYGDVTSLQTTVAAKPNIFRQNEQPAVTEPIGSIWYDTANNNKAYILVLGSPNTWEETRDEGLIAEIANKPFIFRQNDQPAVTNPVGSLWYYTNEGNKLYVLTAGSPNTWNATVDASIATAQETADSRPKVFRQATAPATTEPQYSIWYDTSDNNKAYVLVSSVWTETLDGRVTDLLDFVESKYSLTADANGVITGMELYSSSGPNTVRSEVKFTADKFIIQSSTYEATPFVLDNNALKLNVPLNGVSGTFSGNLFASLGANSVVNPDAYVAFGNVEVSNVGATITKNFPVLELSDDFRAIQARRAIYINTVLDDAQEFTGIRFFGTQLDANGDEDLLNKGMSIKADELKLQFFNDPGGTYVPSKLKWRDAQKVVGGTTYKTEIYAEYNSDNRPYIVIDGDVRFQGDVDLGTGQIVGHPIINAGTSTSNAAGTSTVIKNIDLDGNGHVLDTESISLTLDNITAAGNTTNNNIFVNNVIADAVIFDTANPETALPVGGLTWNATESTLDLKLNESVTLQVGQEELLKVVNKTGATLNEADFRAVRIRSVAEGGAQGQRLAVLLAQGNNDANSATTIGLVTQTILNNQEGFITLSGKVNGINTTGAKSYLGLETWADGDILYLSPTQPGYLTNVKPQAPQHTIIVGWVVYAHQNNGKIFVKVDNGYEIDELHNVKINGVTAGDLLVYNDVTSVWENKKSIAGLTMTGSLVGPTNFIIDPAVEGADSGTVEIKGGIDVNGDANFDGNVVIDGNLTVSGSTITIEATNLSLVDNMIYLNAGSTVSNPDLGFAGNYNDGGYAHTGLFRDATDGRWKFFQGYVPEPDASAFIDTADTSFALAPLQVATLYGNVQGNLEGNVLGNLEGDVTGDLFGNADTATDAEKLGGKLPEEFTLAYVTSNNNSTTNSISVGNITSGSINASGAINGKIILNKTYASVSTTAQAVVGLNAVTSEVAENALFELTVFGEGWYHKAVITCYHDGTLGGDWSAYLSINEGDGVIIFSTSQVNGVLTINVLSTDALATPAVYVHVEYLGELNNLIQNPV